MTLLKIGSRGPEVGSLQNSLNTKLRPSPNLVPDGIFGHLTDAAVRRFQSDNWLVVDGQAGPCTQNCLHDRETYRPILHNIPFMAQPTQTTCWATSTAMMNRSTVAAVIARTPSDLIALDGGLRNFSETDDAITGGQRYAQAHNLRMQPPMSWGLGLLRRRLSQSALIFDMLWDASGYTTKNTVVPGQWIGSSGHMVVVVGMRGDDDPTGLGTTLRIHDPWPPNRGARYSVGHAKWMTEVSTRTYRVFHH
jgi:hypothetical protein